MSAYRYVYGPVPSRRLGLSLGISPIPPKYCNYSCIYCQLGRTIHLTNQRQAFFPVGEILTEFDAYLKESVHYDVVTLVGEGEPTLYLGLGELIRELKKRTDKPVVVITNGALLYDPAVRSELMEADIVLPSFDAPDEKRFKRINRPHGQISFDKVWEGLKVFSKMYKGQLWIEIMLIKNVNDDLESLQQIKERLCSIKYDRLYLNVPVRPPAEPDVEEPSKEKMSNAVKILSGLSMTHLVSEGFYSGIEDDYDAVKSIIRRHPMNQHEIQSFLKSRACEGINPIITALEEDEEVEVQVYKNVRTYRINLESLR